MRDHRAESRLRQARGLGADDLPNVSADGNKEHYNVSTTTEAVRPLSDEELAAVELPDFERKYIKAQPLYQSGSVKDKSGNTVPGREFNAGGPKATMVAKYIMHGGYTRKEIADFCSCSVSRVGEVLWAMDAGNVEHPEILRRREPAKPEPKTEEATDTELVEPTIVLQDNEDDETETDEDDQDDEA